MKFIQKTAIVLILFLSFLPFNSRAIEDPYAIINSSRSSVMEGKDPYATLGVEKNATKKEIEKAYKNIALMWHPDKNNSPEATAKFQNIGKAYKAALMAFRSADDVQEVIAKKQKNLTFYDLIGIDKFADKNKIENAIEDFSSMAAQFENVISKMISNQTRIQAGGSVDFLRKILLNDGRKKVYDFYLSLPLADKNKHHLYRPYRIEFIDIIDTTASYYTAAKAHAHIDQLNVLGEKAAAGEEITLYDLFGINPKATSQEIESILDTFSVEYERIDPADRERAAYLLGCFYYLALSATNIALEDDIARSVEANNNKVREIFLQPQVRALYDKYLALSSEEKKNYENSFFRYWEEAKKSYWEKAQDKYASLKKWSKKNHPLAMAKEEAIAAAKEGLMGVCNGLIIPSIFCALSKCLGSTVSMVDSIPEFVVAGSCGAATSLFLNGYSLAKAQMAKRWNTKYVLAIGIRLSLATAFSVLAYKNFHPVQAHTVHKI